jgi:hypothetical protein
MDHASIHGDVVTELVLSYLPDDMPYVTLTIAIDTCFPSAAEQTGQPSRCEVVAYRRLAENTALTLRPGMTVTITGRHTTRGGLPGAVLAPDGWLEATDIAVSLGCATAEVTIQQRQHHLRADLTSDVTARPW